MNSQQCPCYRKMDPSGEDLSDVAMSLHGLGTLYMHKKDYDAVSSENSSFNTPG